MAATNSEQEDLKDKQMTFLNSFSIAASKKQLNDDSKLKPGLLVSEPNFEEEISIEVEADEEEQKVEVQTEIKAIIEAPLASRNHLENKAASSATSLGTAGLVGNVAKLKNSKLYQKFMQKKDTIVPTPPKPEVK